MIERISFFVIGCICLSILLISPSLPHPILPHYVYGGVDTEFTGGTMLFVGDVMLARHVETLMREHGVTYPFMMTDHIISYADVAIGNFEGTVPDVHTHTPNFTYNFSVRSEYLSTLKEVGFEVLSLANNHGLDYGADAYENTRTVCETVSISCFGHPYDLLPHSYRIVTIGDVRVGLLFIHETQNTLNEEKLSDLIRLMESTSDVQIAYVHWGEEYALKNSSKQSTRAHMLIDNGVDAVIGHHPHVVQNIELYKNKPIYYSLGNFVFDQYFDDRVTEGLGVLVEITKDTLVFRPVPFSSRDVKSQPRLMSTAESKNMLTRIYGLEEEMAALDLSDAVKITVPW